MKQSCTEVLRVSPGDQHGGLRESLASLIIRTARENDISPGVFLEQKYASGALDGLRCNSRALGTSIGQSINGSSDIARAFVERTEQLTQYQNLQASTLLAFAPFTTMNGLQRRHQAWCMEFLRNQDMQYYPLLWSLEPVRVCLATKKPLSSLCPQCRKPLATLSGGSWVGRCNYCGVSLSSYRVKGSTSTDPVGRAIKDLNYEIWIAEQLGEFIRYQVNNRLPESYSYTRTLSFWLDKFNIKNTSSSAKELGASQQAISNWLGNQAIPRLRMTLNLCWVFGVSLMQFLKMEEPKGHDGKLQQSMEGGVRHNSPSRRRRIDKPALEKELTAILRSNRYATMSFSEICRSKLGRSDIVVRETFPELSKVISKRYLENRRLTSEVRRDQLCAAIFRYANFLHTRGIVPNHKTLSQYVDRPSLLRCSWAITAIKEVRLKLGYEDEAEQLFLAV